MMISDSEILCKKFETICERILRNDQVRYVCLINKMGRLIAERKQENVDFLLSDKKSREMYLKLKLQSSLIKDFDDQLGELEYLSAMRKKVQMIIIPIYGYVIMLSVEKTVDAKSIARQTIMISEEIIS